MNVFKNVKKYFGSKQDRYSLNKVPNGDCPNCWGEQEWDGQFYKKIKSKSANATHLYNTFIKKVVSRLGKITIKGTTYKCETCMA